MTPAVRARLERLVARLAIALNIRALYEAEHPALAPALAGVLEAVQAACDARRQDSVTFLLLGEDLVVDDHPLTRGGLHQQPVLKALRRQGIERLTLARGLEPAEALRLVEALAAGRLPASTAHVRVGQIEVTGQADAAGAEALPAARLDAACEAFLRFRRERRTALAALDELVWGLVDALGRSTRAMLPLVPLKEHDEYTFVHSVNVALLVLAQGRSFGFEGPTLHGLGLAALLHDVGKLSIPLEVLNKPGRLDDAEWRVMMSHAELGARQLAMLEGPGALPVLVAYEHHLRYDGEPSYPALRTPRPPTLAGQLTAIADVYDAVCTARPYRKPLARAAAVGVLRARAGSFHDPFLVGNFLRLLGVAAESPLAAPPPWRAGGRAAAARAAPAVRLAGAAGTVAPASRTGGPGPGLEGAGRPDGNGGPEPASRSEGPHRDGTRPRGPHAATRAAAGQESFAARAPIVAEAPRAAATPVRTAALLLPGAAAGPPHTPSGPAPAPATGPDACARGPGRGRRGGAHPHRAALAWGARILASWGLAAYAVVLLAALVAPGLGPRLGSPLAFALGLASEPVLRGVAAWLPAGWLGSFRVAGIDPLPGLLALALLLARRRLTRLLRRLEAAWADPTGDAPPG